ncbi:unnamed protein product [Phytomonas sp. EM1]|nr:unnamed protein product [Phytomonas sp. EM1]|eukprot:CCW59641.1 unnamed protein product [Phytomonas sp. isolate EM1]
MYKKADLHATEQVSVAGEDQKKKSVEINTFNNANPMSILQTAYAVLDLPKNDEVWSAWYNETDDAFNDFKSFQPDIPTGGSFVPGSGGSMRTLSARQISGQFEEEVAKSWEDDWEDEDIDDTFDCIMGQISHYETSVAAASME